MTTLATLRQALSWLFASLWFASMAGCEADDAVNSSTPTGGNTTLPVGPNDV